MEEAHDTAGTQSESPIRGRSWLTTAALAIIAIVGVVAATIIFTMDSGAPDAPPTSSNNGAGAPTLTDQEAIDRYLELEQTVVRAYANVDPNLLPHIYTADSPTVVIVRDELERLRRMSARLVGTYETLDIEVVSRSSDEIVLNQEVIVRGRLQPVGDVKVTARYHDQRQVVRIILRWRESDGWLIHRVHAIESERLTQ